MATTKQQRSRKQPEKSEEEQAQKAADAAEQNGAAVDTKSQTELRELREEAEKIKAENEYKGNLTADIFNALQELLYRPIPARFIKHTPPGQGHQFEQTGVKSVQVQLDRLNAVLGPQHFRPLTMHTDGGTICKAVVVVGNNLQWAQLDESGKLVPYTVIPSGGNGAVTVKEADVIAERHGWGGWKRGTQPGDVYKASETNALKRVLARFGPASEVYTQDFEDDPEDTAPEIPVSVPQPQAQPEVPQQPAQSESGGQVQRGQPMSEDQAESALADLLNDDQHPLHKLRNDAHQAMLDLPEKPPATVRLQLIAARADSEAALTELLARAQTQQ